MDNIDKTLITVQLSTYWIAIWILLSGIQESGIMGYGLTITILVFNTVALGNIMKCVDEYK